MNFKVTVTKWIQKFTFIRSSESENSLREELHKEWFSIMSIEKMDSIEISWNKFYFEIIQNWNLKTWTISSQDIFKAYFKIKYELKYDLKYIYQDKETPLEEKEKIIHDLDEQYYIYLKTNKKEIKEEKNNENDKIKKEADTSTQSFQMRKELEETYKIIDRILVKIKFFTELKDFEFLNFEKKESLNQIYNELLKLKSSTNIFKLRQVWEVWLLKVWEIELKILESKKSEEVRKLLKETNSLLKHVWSKVSLVEKDKDLWFLFNKFIKNFKENLDLDKRLKKKTQIDKKSTSYLKSKLTLSKYEEKLNDINKEISKNIQVFLIPTEENKKTKEYLILKKKVIKQNLSILKVKLTWNYFSYVKLVKWYDYFIWKVLDFIEILKKPLFFIILFFSLFFIIINSLNSIWIFDVSINFKWIFYYLLALILYILINFTKWFFSLIFNIVIFSFIFIFWVINF